MINALYYFSYKCHL